MSKWVEIYTDCSFHPVHKIAAYAFGVISITLPTIKYVTNIIPFSVESSTLGELIAITEGLYKAHRLTLKKNIFGFRVITDSKGAQKMINDGTHRHYEVRKQLQRIEALRNRGFVINVYWTKAHTKDTTTMNATINNKVDRLAKHALRKHIKALTNGNQNPDIRLYQDGKHR